MTAAEKLGIGVKIAQPLLRKIISDLSSVANLDELQHESVFRLDSRYGEETKIRSMDRLVRTRLYFTSESHVHALLNVLRYGALADKLAQQREWSPSEGSTSEGLDTGHN